jgi:23S rRNA (uracil1939-C5)-methyltransferase
MRYLLPSEMAQEELSKPKTFALGFHAPGNFEKVLDLDTCYLAKECMNRVLAAVRDFALERCLAPYAAKVHEGYLRNLMLRYSERHDQLMINIVTSWYDKSIMQALKQQLEAALPGQKMTILNNVTTRKNTVAIGEQEYIISGDGFVTERLGDLDFRISANSFFQTNTLQAETLYEQIIAVGGIAPEDTVYDLYCGTGTITLKVTVSQLGHENRLVVKDQVDVKTPKPLRESSIWFYNQGQRGLSRRDPNQGELDLAVVPMRPRVGTAIATTRSDRPTA